MNLASIVVVIVVLPIIVVVTEPVIVEHEPLSFVIAAHNILLIVPLSHLPFFQIHGILLHIEPLDFPFLLLIFVPNHSIQRLSSYYVLHHFSFYFFPHHFLSFLHLMIFFELNLLISPPFYIFPL